MKMNFKRTGAMLLACAIVGGTIPPYAGVSFGTAITANAAVTGQGTEDSPYIVTTYDELKELIAPSDAWDHLKTVDTMTYVKLGADIEVEDEANNQSFKLYSNSSGIWTIKLDLAGHTLSRKTYSVEQTMFTIGSNSTLVIDDSVGGGEMVSDIHCGTQLAYMFYVPSGGNLIFNKGTFKSFGDTIYDQRCIETAGGNLTINGGTFKAISYIVENQGGQITINDGTFIQKKDCKYAQDGISLHSKDILNNAVLKSEDTTTHIWCYLSKNTDLADQVISQKSKVIVDGTELAREDFQNIITGKEIIIKAPKVIDTVDITINEPKAGQPVSFSAKTDDPDHVTTYTILNERRRYNRIDSWLEYDFLNKKDVPVYEGATFKAGKTYTAKFKIMTTDSDDVFSDDLKVTVNGKDVKNLEVSPTYATFCTTYNVKSTALKGDVNNDGIINVTDITKIAAHIKNKKKLNEEEQKRADVNNDGRINVTDITKIAAHIKGKKLLN
ncbi:MAG: dockerin type I repeat-containing protein [Ruminococcus sp.]|uniref:dockerin type I repeat-containing protein n=1 Tax=Ruminococcus sp. TaxID=41978 RepID=UPI0025E9622A|nr:dockerin type I repeat-containing protein [Ruminococcus sp.]MCR5539870.1 dockerin type I repeat-containing protein [Ruminococcus sp.]